MELITTINEYDFYVGQDEDGMALYNILPEGSKIPDTGYYAKEYISHVKNQSPNTFGNFTPKIKETFSYAFKQDEMPL